MQDIINQFIQVVPITLLIGIIYIIIRIAYLKRKKVNIKYKKEILYLIFVCYIIGLFNLVLVPSDFWTRIWNLFLYGTVQNPLEEMFNFEYNLIPTLYKVIKGEYILGSWVKTMMIGNIIMFIPFGVLLQLCFKKINNKNIFIYSLIIPLIIETIQPIIGRSFDIDDLITNFIGIIVGYIISKLINKLTKFSKC